MTRGQNDTGSFSVLERPFYLNTGAIYMNVISGNQNFVKAYQVVKLSRNLRLQFH